MLHNVMDIHGYLPTMSSYAGGIRNLSLDLWEGLRDAEAANGLLESSYIQSWDIWNTDI